MPRQAGEIKRRAEATCTSPAQWGMMVAMQPLKGIKVVTIAFNLPGPAALWQLDRWGAEVIKVEPPGGDPTKRNCPQLYNHLLGNQRAVELDLKNDQGRTALREHLQAADLLITSSLPASLERMGLDWDSLHAKYPRLCQVAIVGHAPPEVERTGHDLTYQASMGLLSPPAMPLTLMADMAGAQTAVSHALAVLAERARSGEGLISYVPIAGALEFFTLPLRYGLTVPGGPLGGGAPFYNIYPTADGWLAVGTLEPHFWAKLQTLVGAKQGTYEEMKAIFLTRSAEDWEQFGHQHRLPLAVVRQSPPA